MAAITTLRPGKTYEVIQAFIDYDQQHHAVGEIWTLIAQSFVPYDDGLLLEIQQQGKRTSFRMQWRAESQGVVMDDFLNYVRLVL